ncbi:MotA/TolQ/ExbB proton channel family protein [Clostridia bacterium OttesenSCG-928-F22]|nr:MotA/TolQ/ExbB proton channel family protein [Clostridia bacterium OttesenSCG-928-F22]
MEKTTVIGIVAGFIVMVVSIILTGASIGSYIDPASLFIVLGGAICAVVASYSGKKLKLMVKTAKLAFKQKTVDLQKDIDMIIDIANIARREGLLALEDAISNLDEPFFKKGVMLVVDGADPELIKSVMEAEIYFIQDRHGQAQAMFDHLAALSPAFGMVGTLIGLINMLLNLDDQASLGPNMAVAIVTTLYGVIFANLIFTPISKKLKARTADEAIEKELLLEGLLSIQDGENPRIIRDKLNAFIARSEIKEEGESSSSQKEETKEIEK